MINCLKHGMTHPSLRPIRLKTLLWPITEHDKLLEPGLDTSLGSIGLKTNHRAEILDNIHEDQSRSINYFLTCEWGMTLFQTNHKAQNIAQTNYMA
jgi:hypothetical protein